MAGLGVLSRAVATEDDSITILGTDAPEVRIGGLDGLRALAVAAVVVYHLAPRTLPAGYLGVDVFMVISGFIVTSILVRERHRSGTIRVGAFWGRRFRRLVPALAFMVIVVATWARFVQTPTVLAQTRTQGVAALLYVTNWQLIRDSVSYGGATAALSPFVHLWSLAVEEQFYLVWPLLLLALLRLGRGKRGVAAIVATAGAIASGVWMAALYHPGHDPIRAYYGTDTRAQAFLAGAVSALVLPMLSRSARRVVARVGALALVGVAAAMFTTSTEWLYRGGFGAFALVAAVVVVASTVRGPVAWCCDRRPLRAVGRVSYGVYLWHWPAIVLLTSDRLGFGGVRLLALRLAVTAVGTLASWFLVERPFARWRPRRIAVRGGVVIAVGAVALMTLPVDTFAAFASSRIDHMPAAVVVAPPRRSAVRRSKVLTVVRTSPTHTPSTTVPLATHLALSASGTAMLVGDSGMTTATPAMSAALETAGWRVVQTAFPGIGLTQPGDIRTRWATNARQYHVDLTIIMIGGWDQKWIDDNGSDAYRRVVADAYDAFTAGGGKVLWLSIMPAGNTLNSPDRKLDRYYQDIVRAHPGQAEYLEVAPALAAPGGRTWPQFVNGLRYRMRDGWHLCPAGAAAFAHFTLSYLGLDRPGWDRGPWKYSSDYRDPWNACTVP